MFSEVKCPRCGTQHAAVSREDVAQIIARNPGAEWKDFERCSGCDCSSQLFVPTEPDDPPVLTMPVVARPERNIEVLRKLTKPMTQAEVDRLDLERTREILLRQGRTEAEVAKLLSNGEHKQ